MSADQPDRGPRVEFYHRRHVDHPTWEVPQVPGDLFPAREAAMLRHDLQHRPICAVVEALRPGETARVFSDHPVGPLCHAIDDGCADLVAWELEQGGPTEWVLLLTRRSAEAGDGRARSMGVHG